MTQSMPLPFLDDLQARTRSVDIANSLCGLGFSIPADNPTRRIQYINALFPFDKPVDALSFSQHMSSCALTALALLRQLGVDDKRLQEPYAKHIGEAVSLLVSIAKENNAWVTCSDPQTMDDTAAPQEGDIVLIGSTDDPSFGGTEHVLTATYRLDDAMMSIDGGQPDSPGSQILERRRVLVRKNRELWACSTDPPYSTAEPAKGRRVVGYLDITKLDLSS